MKCQPLRAIHLIVAAVTASTLVVVAASDARQRPGEMQQCGTVTGPVFFYQGRTKQGTTYSVQAMGMRCSLARAWAPEMASRSAGSSMTRLKPPERDWECWGQQEILGEGNTKALRGMCGRAAGANTQLFDWGPVLK